MEYDINEDDFAYKEYIKYGEKKQLVPGFYTLFLKMDRFANRGIYGTSYVNFYLIL